MPPATPTMIRLRSISSLFARGSSLPSPEAHRAYSPSVCSSRSAWISRSAIDSGFSCRPGSTSGPTYSRMPVAELVVVVVDLPRALGGVDHQRVLARRAVQQLVDGRVGDAQRRVVSAVTVRIEIDVADGGQRRVGVRGAHEKGLLAFGENARVACGLASPPSPALGLSGGHQQGYQFSARRLQLTVHDDLVEVVLGGQFGAGGGQAAMSSPRASRCPRPVEPALQRLPAGRGEEHRDGLGHRLLDGPGAGQIDLDEHRMTRRCGVADRLGRASRTGAARRGFPPTRAARRRRSAAGTARRVTNV